MAHIHAAIHPSVSHLHHITGVTAHSTLHTLNHHPAANTSNAAALAHTTSLTHTHTTAASRLRGSPSVATNHPSFTMHAHRGIPGGAMAGFNRGFNRGGFNNNYNNGNGGYGYDNGYDSGWYLPSLFYSVLFPDEYPYFDPYDDYDDYGYPGIYDSYYPAPAATYNHQYQQAAQSWVTAENGDVPDNAVVNGSENNVTTYYCREEFNGKMYYGLLIPKDGCYVQEQSATMKFDNYEVMVQ
jgi:hypothetical protein